MSPALWRCLASMCLVGSGLSNRQSFSLDRKQALLQAVDSVDEMVKHHIATDEHLSHSNIMDSIRSLAQKTPGIHQSFKDTLTNVVKDIKETVDPKIKNAHGATQEMIADAVDLLRQSTSEALAFKKDANKSDHAWFNCVRDEVHLLEAAETADKAVADARSSTSQPCQLMEDSTKVIWNADSNDLFFACHIRGKNENCDDQFTNYNKALTDMIDGLEDFVEAASVTYLDAKGECEDAEKELVRKQRSHSSAVQKWTEKRGTCQNLRAVREEAVCLFGSAVQEKCSSVLPAYHQLIQLVGESGNEHSRSDRVAEYTTSSLVKCLLERSAMGSVLENTDIEACTTSVDYHQDIGTLDDGSEAVESLLTPENVACENQDVAFVHKIWEVPDSVAKAADYKLVSDFTLALSVDGGSSPFEFCEGLCTIVHVGSHRSPGQKKVPLPYWSMHCSADPFNAQNHRWKDKFEVHATRGWAYVERIDADGGWGQDLAIKCCKTFTTGYAWQIVSVGDSKEGSKKVDLPQRDMMCDSTPQNPQEPHWGDMFSTSVIGSKLTVDRVNNKTNNVGWTQHLELKCSAGPELVVQAAATAASRSKHMLLDGCSSREDVYPGYGPPRAEFDSKQAGEAICCNAEGQATRHLDGSTGPSTGLFNFFKMYIDCLTIGGGIVTREDSGRTYNEAKELCEDMGLRLCRSQEEVDTSCKTGCHMDAALVWVELTETGPSTRSTED